MHEHTEPVTFLRASKDKIYITAHAQPRTKCTKKSKSTICQISNTTRDADKDGDNRITFEEFKHMIEMVD